jgi:hypothetical protein
VSLSPLYSGACIDRCPRPVHHQDAVRLLSVTYTAGDALSKGLRPDKRAREVIRKRRTGNPNGYAVWPGSKPALRSEVVINPPATSLPPPRLSFAVDCSGSRPSGSQRLRQVDRTTVLGYHTADMRKTTLFAPDEKGEALRRLSMETERPQAGVVPAPFTELLTKSQPARFGVWAAEPVAPLRPDAGQRRKWSVGCMATTNYRHPKAGTFPQTSRLGGGRQR